MNIEKNIKDLKKTIDLLEANNKNIKEGFMPLSSQLNVELLTESIIKNASFINEAIIKERGSLLMLISKNKNQYFQKT